MLHLELCCPVQAPNLVFQLSLQALVFPLLSVAFLSRRAGRSGAI